ncbi:MAG: 50S ribosomal protein L17 [Thermotogae bacterium]|nr:50S ribosomal protein L17 [Thermotogota bacterium]
MRHRDKRIKLGREREHRKALLRNLAREMIEHYAIETTTVRAKAAKSLLEHLLQLAKEVIQNPELNVHNRRKAFRILADRKYVNRLFDEIAPKVKGVRLVRVKIRRGDAAEISRLEFIL